MKKSEFNEDKCLLFKCKYLYNSIYPYCARISEKQSQAEIDFLINNLRFTGKMVDSEEKIKEEDIEFDCPYELESIMVEKKDLPDWEGLRDELLEELNIGKGKK